MKAASLPQYRHEKFLKSEDHVFSVTPITHECNLRPFLFFSRLRRFTPHLPDDPPPEFASDWYGISSHSISPAIVNTGHNPVSRPDGHPVGNRCFSVLPVK